VLVIVPGVVVVVVEVAFGNCAFVRTSDGTLATVQPSVRI